MKTKRFAIVVCLILIVFTFSASVAEDQETVTTVTCQPGALLGDIEALDQICDIAAVRVHSMPEGYGALMLVLNDVDTLSVLLKFEENGVYLESQALGVTPLYFSWEDLKTLMTEQMESDPDVLAASSMYGGEFFQAMLDGTMTEEQAMEMMGIDEVFMTFIADIQAAQSVETGAFSLDGSDIASQKTVTELTQDDMIRAMDLTIVRKSISNQIMMESPSLTEEELDAEVDELLAEAKQELEESDLTVTVTTYSSDGAFVAFEFRFSGEMENETGAMTFTVTKTSIDQAEFYQMKFKLSDAQDEYANQYASLYVSDAFVSGKLQLNSFESEPILTAAFNCDTSEPDHMTGEFTATSYDDEDLGLGSLLVTFDRQRNDVSADTAVNLYVSEGSVDDIKAAMNDSGLIGFRFRTIKQPNSGFFAGLEGAAPDTSVQPLQMTESELNAYLQAIQQSMTMSLLTVVENLPPDISDALMQEMGFY